MVLPSVVIATPLAAAGLFVVVGKRVDRRIVLWSAIAAATVVVALTLAVLREVLIHGPLIEWVGGWHPGNRVGLGIALAVDLASACIAPIVACTMLAAIVFSYEYFEEIGPIFCALLLAMLGAMIGFSYSADAFNLFVWYEVFSVGAYALATIHSESESAYAGALQFALTNSVAGLFFLIGITLLEARTGQLGLVPIGHALAAERRVDALLVTSFSFITIGLLTRGALVPLQFWFDEVQAAAPAPLSAVIAGGMTPLALYAFARIYWTVFAHVFPPNHGLVALTIAAGGLSAFYGSLMCLRESRLKRKLAHASVAHAGVALALIGEYTSRALAAAATYAVTYATAAAALFFALAILRTVAHEYDSKLLRGAGRRLPLTALAFALGAIGFTALGANVRVAAGSGTPHAGLVVAVIMMGTTAATGGAFIAVFVRVFLMTPRTVRVDTGSPPWFLLTPAVALGVLSLSLGVTPYVILMASRAAGLVVGPGSFASAVMLQPGIDGAFVTIVHPSVRTWLAPLGACSIAFVICSRTVAARRFKIVASRNAVYRLFYRIDDGDSGSYIAYVAGAAVLFAIALARCYGIAA